MLLPFYPSFSHILHSSLTWNKNIPLSNPVVLVSLSKTLNYNCFSSPRNINGTFEGRDGNCVWFGSMGWLLSSWSWDGSMNDITGPMTGVIMFMLHECQTWWIPAQYKCPLQGRSQEFSRGGALLVIDVGRGLRGGGVPLLFANLLNN